VLRPPRIKNPPSNMGWLRTCSRTNQLSVTVSAKVGLEAAARE